MAKNIEININNGSSYEVLYPKTLGLLVDGKVSSSGNSDVATKLETSRSIRTNLASTSVANFDGTGNITPGVNGVLGVGNGGTGVTSYSSLASQLSSYISSGGLKTESGTLIGSSTTTPTIISANLSTINFAYLSGYIEGGYTYINKKWYFCMGFYQGSNDCIGIAGVGIDNDYTTVIEYCNISSTTSGGKPALSILRATGQIGMFFSKNTTINYVLFGE